VCELFSIGARPRCLLAAIREVTLLAESDRGLVDPETFNIKLILHRTSNFTSKAETWNFTVRSERFSLAAISLFVRPFVTSSNTSC
jgi:hypothetical protein